DGIRGRTVTGVQTCALPISCESAPTAAGAAYCDGAGPPASSELLVCETLRAPPSCQVHRGTESSLAAPSGARLPVAAAAFGDLRSEERRVGKGGRAEWVGGA